MRCLVHSGRRWRWPSRGTGTSDALAIAASQGMRFALPMVLMSNARLRRLDALSPAKPELHVRPLRAPGPRARNGSTHVASKPEPAAARVRTTSWFTARRTRTSTASLAAATVGISRQQDGIVTRRTKRLDDETPGAAACHRAGCRHRREGHVL
jgi:hypothetical protein